MTHEIYMQRCIELARNGLGTTYPNPLVGSVIVHQGIIIGEGWHQKAGAPHAEVNAICSVKNKELLSESTIYVNLEPCSHFGKTPPCCDLILEHHIPNIVIGTQDPFAEVAGRGIHKLLVSGKNVTVGVCEADCLALNQRFFTFHQQKRPYIILKWAESQDGFIAPKTQNKKTPFWISNPYSRQRAHQWRSQEQAILVGTQTVLKDNPKLDTRDWEGNSPVRLILDRSGKISADFHVMNDEVTTYIFTEKPKTLNLQNTFAVEIDFNGNIAQQVIDFMYKKNLQSLIVEGGKQTLQTFIDASLWDEARIFSSKIKLGDGTARPICESEKLTTESILNDKLTTLYNTKK